MVVGTSEHGMQADIIFVIEGTAINGAYINDLKSNYVIPTLEYFSQGNIDEREYFSENSCLYGIVTYQAADCLPHPSSDTLGPYTSPSRLLNAFEKLELIGGKGESHANIAEGLATALLCFEELQQKRDGVTIAQKHCILVCNSPPYLMPVMETHNYSGKTCEQLAVILQERGINLSILSPRKIPALFKLFEKAGGDLSTSQTKNYAKDPRHLVLLKGYCLKERPISPPPGAMPAQQQQPPQHPQLPIASMPSPLPDSPMPNQPAQAMLNPSNQIPTQPAAMVGQIVGRPGHIPPGQFSAQPIQAPPGYNQPPVMGNRPPPRWPMMPPQQRPPFPNQGSALIAQLTQPPTPAVNQFQNLPLGGNPQMNNPPQGALRIPMLNQTGPVQSTNVLPQSQPAQQQQQQTAMQPQTSQAGTMPGHNQPNQQLGAPRERHTIWQGILECMEKVKNDQQKVTRHIPCSVTANNKEGEPEIKADSWPQKLTMQIMPKQLIGNIGGNFLKNSRSVLFHPQNCEALESITKLMSNGFAGCVHFTPTACDIKILILLYTAEKRAYLGFIPNDQTAFVDRLRKVIQQQKSNQQLLRQGQVPNAGPQMNQGPAQAMGQQQPQLPGSSTPTSQPPNSQQGIMLSQTNTMAMGGGQITQNVVTSASQQPNIGGVLGQDMQQQGGPQNPQAPNTLGMRLGIMGGPQQRPAFDTLEVARKHNLEKINHLKQTLEAAQQQEAQYKSQLEIINQMKTQQLQEALQAAQQQELQYKKLQMENRQMGGGGGPQPNSQQHMMRPILSNNPGLRHLLQQQPQYRQQLIGIQQMPGNARGQPMGQQMQNAGNQGQQQFDDVPNFDFM